jgi:hypothetical protein
MGRGHAQQLLEGEQSFSIELINHLTKEHEMNNITYITERCGARWLVSSTRLQGERAFWIFKVGGYSVAKPSIVGFYAPSINAACDALNN